MTTEAPWLVPDWPAPARVRALSTTRQGGVSEAPYGLADGSPGGLNLGTHVGDDAAAVAANRARLAARLPAAPGWLEQVHGCAIATEDQFAADGVVPQADASIATSAGRVCAAMTADCLPALFCNRAGTRVAAAHAGWRGLAAGVLEATAESLQAEPADILVWLGPAIGPQAFEVGPEVREAFIKQLPEAAKAFVPSHNAGKFMADIYLLARLRLAERGVTAVYGGGFCTVTDPRFFSYRRASRTGRFASLVWLSR